MVRIEIDGQFLRFAPKSKVRMRYRNAVMYEDVLPNDYILPFNIPLNLGNNAELLGYPYSLQNRKPLSKKIDCLVHVSEGQPRQSVLSFKSADPEFAEASVVMGKNVDDVGETNLRDMDLGSYTMENSVVQVITLHITPNNIFYPGYLATPGKLLKITINDLEITTPVLALTSPTYVTAYNNLIAAINGAQTAVTASGDYSGGSEGAKLILTSNTSGTEGTFTLNLDKYLVEYETDHHAWFWTVIEEDTWINNHISNYKTRFYNRPEADATCPVTFPIAKNPKYSDNELFVGYQNYKIEGNFAHFDTQEAFVTPFPKFVPVLTKVMEKLGFTITGSFIQDNDVNDFIFYSNVASDYWHHVYGDVVSGPDDLDPFDQVYEIGKKINIHASKIYVARHCPDCTIKEFLKAIKIAFNLTFDYNEVNKTVNVEIADHSAAVNISGAIDYTKKAVLPLQINTSEGETSSLKLFRWTEDNSDELQKTLQDFQKELVVNILGDKAIEPTISSIAETREMLTAVGDAGPFELNHSMPSLQLPGCFNGGGSPNKIKLLQYRGRMNGGVPPYAIATSTGFDMATILGFRNTAYSLSWYGEKGLYEKCWKNLTYLINEKGLVKCLMTFSQEDVQKFKKQTFHRIGPNILAWKDIDMDMGEGSEPAECIYQLL